MIKVSSHCIVPQSASTSQKTDLTIGRVYFVGGLIDWETMVLGELRIRLKFSILDLIRFPMNGFFSIDEMIESPSSANSFSNVKLVPFSAAERTSENSV